MDDKASGTIKLISLNIEGDNHLDRVTKFLVGENPDVICLQEVFLEDVGYLEKILGMSGQYAPLMDVRQENLNRLTPKGLWGLLILTKHPIINLFSRYYVGSRAKIPVYDDNNPNSPNRALLGADLIKANHQFTIITTHFTYSSNGIASPLQHSHLDQMLKLLSKVDEFILCGDFNAPRGGEIYTRLAELYTDNIPPEIKTTIDPKLHKVNNLQYVVDGMFSTPNYQVESVRVVGGLSDHKAIVGLVQSQA